MHPKNQERVTCTPQGCGMRTHEYLKKRVGDVHPKNQERVTCTPQGCGMRTHEYLKKRVGDVHPKNQERVMGFEPTNTTLGRWCLTTWRHPHFLHIQLLYLSRVMGVRSLPSWEGGALPLGDTRIAK